jgi:hypothetical protein
MPVVGLVEKKKKKKPKKLYSMPNNHFKRKKTLKELQNNLPRNGGCCKSCCNIQNSKN